ncbi:IclR family transcriptional regulator [Rhodococcus opacus]|uniref:IclR family transcriptional regulator n=1 Tax=Rhodococcus opacus TaxID=37919 RepID=A0AAX3YSQ8_RHOOP|nr:IclR family transcriptional regulator [Rhodococcus opacus]MCZ4587595.1 IclR family transcriptional regulator [Rhodococcus opacus]WLF51406.1 IclR family transcriptional regulator [Rhodococcus opacus]
MSKAFAILNVFSEGRCEATLTDICQTTGLPLTTALRLARELVACGALERATDGRYRVGLRLWETGTLATPSRDLRTKALPLMQDLYELTHENVQLAVIDRGEALVLEKIEGRRTTQIWSRVGGRLPLHATGLGKALLANSKAEVLHEVCRDGLRPYTPHTLVMPGRLAADLDEIRRRGYAINREEMQLGRSSVAAPVIGTNDEIVASIGVGVRSLGLTIPSLAPAVCAAAAEITKALARQTSAV